MEKSSSSKNHITKLKVFHPSRMWRIELNWRAWLLDLEQQIVVWSRFSAIVYGALMLFGEWQNIRSSCWFTQTDISDERDRTYEMYRLDNVYWQYIQLLEENYLNDVLYAMRSPTERREYLKSLSGVRTIDTVSRVHSRCRDGFLYRAIENNVNRCAHRNKEISQFLIISFYTGISYIFDIFVSWIFFFFFNKEEQENDCDF